jgi:hypothetical protein
MTRALDVVMLAHGPGMALINWSLTFGQTLNKTSYTKGVYEVGSCTLEPQLGRKVKHHNSN